MDEGGCYVKETEENTGITLQPADLLATEETYHPLQEGIKSVCQ